MVIGFLGLIMKRLFDIILGSFLLVVSLPLLVIITILLFIDLKEFPFFTQERGLTLDKFRFKIYKLKTIKENISKIPHEIEEDIFLKPGLKNKVSQIAKWLRKTGLDELPQLINVIFGQMSLIGPRPLMLEDLIIIKRLQPEFYLKRGTFNHRPGITGLWQLFGNRSEGIIGMIALETVYEKTASPILDLKLLLYTSSIALRAKNSDSIFFSPNFNLYPTKTIIEDSSNVKVTLNMPEGIAKTILDKVKKYEGKYTIEIPADWWNVDTKKHSELLKNDKKNIFPIQNKKQQQS